MVGVGRFFGVPWILAVASGVFCGLLLEMSGAGSGLIYVGASMILAMGSSLVSWVM